MHYSRLAKANGWSKTDKVKAGTKIQADLTCLRKPRNLVYLGGGSSAAGAVCVRVLAVRGCCMVLWLCWFVGFACFFAFTNKSVVK